MKKIIFALTLFAGLALNAQPKCNWSKVYLTYSNTNLIHYALCNIYKFEIAGTTDTCFKGPIQSTVTIITNKRTLKRDTFYTRAFSKTFTDTGRYNILVKVYNKCLKCDTAFEKPLYVTCSPCNWSKSGFSYSNKCRSYVFELGSFIDSCVKYTTFRYNPKTGRVDTIYGRTFSTTFGDTGTYKFYCKLVNTCKKCDTTYSRVIKVDCVGSVSLNKINNEKYILTPNPVNQGFEVNINERTMYEIIDLSGKIVQTGIVENKYISVEFLKNGIYYFKTNRGLQSFIIQR